MGLYSQAQVNPHAIGIRFGGDGTYNGGEISYQHGMGDANRLEFDLGFNGNSNYSYTFLSGTYQWDWNITEGLNWFVGPGAAVGLWSWNDNNGNKDSGMNVGLGGQIGLEYDFNDLGAPILVSIDTRPMFIFANYNDGFGWGAALGVRYTW